ncbi:hypothetical protein ACQ4PT_047617 [Festuca glaucescens]
MDSMAGDSPEPSSSFSGGGEKKRVYVAMGAGESKAMVLWALQKFPDRDAAAFVLLHVYCHPKFIPISASPALLHMCSATTVDAIEQALPCPLGQLPCKYLGLPLSLSKLRKEDIQPFLDKLARRLPFWKARLLTREGCLAYVQTVLTASVIYQLLALDIAPWVLQLIDWMRRGFLWAGREDAQGGHCLVAWHKVCQPKALGGLGLHNLRWLSAALRVRWIWFQRSSSSKPWLGLDLPAKSDARALFQAAVRIRVGSGERTIFWEDPWIDGLSIACLAPAVLELVRPGPICRRTVQQGLTDNAWVRDITGTLTVDAVVQFLRLWPLIQAVHLDASVADSFAWKFSASDEFATKPTYLACFAGRTAIPAAKELWSSYAPRKHQFFGWLAIQGRCWTADRLQRRGLPNQGVCPLCQTDDEDIDHLLLGCPFAQAVWFNLLRPDGFLRLMPGRGDRLRFWWPNATKRVTAKLDFNSLCLLIIRSIWLERNARIFEGRACLASVLSDRIQSEWREWKGCRSRVGTRIPASQVQEQQLIAHKKMELQKMSDILDEHLLLCAQEKVQAEKLVVESDDVAEGLLQLISERHVTALVMGAAADKHYTKKMMALKSKKAQAVEQQADPFCRIWYICKGTLDVAISNEAMREDRRKSGDQQFSLDRSTSLSDTWCVSNTWLHEPNLGPQTGRTSPCRSYDNETGIVREFDKPGNKFNHMLRELESVRKQAYEEKCSREKAERELLEAFQKARDSENLYLGEAKQRNETEEKLTATMEEVERLTETTDELCEKLQEERKKRLALEKRTAHSDRIIKDLMLQRDKAVREVEVLHAKNGESSAAADGTMHITELSCSEIKEATNNFDHSLKVGESVYGSVYKGFLRHTNVAIKKLNPEITVLQSQFNQEVEILSRVRHPNLVTLIGACKEDQALVYEYMSNGSLDDRLACKDNSKPLSWQLRTRIISDVCSALIFLHSNKPHSIVHSNLKASNIILDGNNVAKLSGFGVCRMFIDEFRNTTTLYRHTHPKGSFAYIDPEYVMTGDLTPQSDVYSFGVVLLRLLTGRPGFGLLKDVQRVVEKGCLEAILDSSAGDWPAMQAEQLARLGLRCCEIRRKNRPDLQTEVWTVLEPMLKSASIMLCSLSFKSVSEDLGDVPSYFICPILQDVMREPLIAADGFTYEAEAIREWIDSGHHTSPMTNLELLHRDLLPNHALRSAIQEWLQTNAN